MQHPQKDNPSSNIETTQRAQQRQSLSSVSRRTGLICTRAIQINLQMISKVSASEPSSLKGLVCVEPVVTLYFLLRCFDLPNLGILS